MDGGEGIEWMNAAGIVLLVTAQAVPPPGLSACFDCRRTDRSPTHFISLGQPPQRAPFTDRTWHDETVRGDLVRLVHDGSICLSRLRFCEGLSPDVDYVPCPAEFLP